MALTLRAAAIYARMLKIMARDLTLRQRPYVFVDRLNAKVTVLFPGQQAHNIASVAQGLSRILRRESTLTLRIRIDYDQIEANTAERYNSDIVLRYVVNEDNLWACSWDYDEASGS